MGTKIELESLPWVVAYTLGLLMTFSWSGLFSLYEERLFQRKPFLEAVLEKVALCLIAIFFAGMIIFSFIAGFEPSRDSRTIPIQNYFMGIFDILASLVALYFGIQVLRVFHKMKSSSSKMESLDQGRERILRGMTLKVGILLATDMIGFLAYAAMGFFYAIEYNSIHSSVERALTCWILYFGISLVLVPMWQLGYHLYYSLRFSAQDQYRSNSQSSIQHTEPSLSFYVK